jgi:hypothetical protein
LWSGVDGGFKVVMGVFLCLERRLWVCDWGEVCFFLSLSSHGSLGLIRAREGVRREREERIKVYLSPCLSF